MDRKKLQNIESLLEELSLELHGKYTEYSDDMIIITIPVDEDEIEFEGVKGYILERKQQQSVIMITFAATICMLHDHPEIDFRGLLKKNYEMIYTKITITDEDYLEVEAATRYDFATADEIKGMIYEVAFVAHNLKKELLKNTEG